MACKPYLEDLLTAFATQFAKQLFFFQYITDKAGHQTVKKSMTENLNVMYSTIVTDASVLFLITIFVHSRFNISCKFCFLLLFIVQQICSRSGSPILGAQIVHIHNDEGKLPLSCTKNIF